MNLPQLHEQALRSTGRIVAAVTDGQWSLPTPDTEWNVTDLVDHIVEENYWVAPLVDGKKIEDAAGEIPDTLLTDNATSAYNSSAELAGKTFNRSGALDGSVLTSSGSMDADEFCRQRILDLTVHGWDLAQATNQETTIESELLDNVWDYVQGNKDLLRSSGVFGPEVKVDERALKQTRLLAALGRCP